MKRLPFYKILFFLSLLFMVQQAFANEKNAMDRAIDEYLHSLSELQRISQLFLVGVEGKTTYSAIEDSSLVYEDKSESIEPLVPGGVLLFSYNISSSVEDFIHYTDSIAHYCKNNNTPRPYIALDQEGGTVNRLRNITSPLPSCKRISDTLSPKQSFNLYDLQASQMRALGIDMNLAPVAEPLTDSNNFFLEDRSYGNVPKTSIYSLTVVNAFQKNRVGSVLKHFPGNTNADPHIGTSIISVTDSELQNEFINPFSFIINASSYTFPQAILMSHACIASYDSDTPACLSHYWVTEVLKERLAYRGIVMSDDIFMGALAKNGLDPNTVAIKAIEAGVDVLMISEKRYASIVKTLLKKSSDDLNFTKRLEETERKVIKYFVAYLLQML